MKLINALIAIACGYYLINNYNELSWWQAGLLGWAVVAASYIALIGRRRINRNKSTASGALEWLLTGFGLLGSVTSWADFDSSSDYSDDGADFDPD